MPYGEGRDPIPAIPEPTVIFMINKCLRGHPDEGAVYECTRKAWVIGERAREQAVYALGVTNRFTAAILSYIANVCRDIPLPIVEQSNTLRSG